MAMPKASLLISAHKSLSSRAYHHFYLQLPGSIRSMYSTSQMHMMGGYQERLRSCAPMIKLTALFLVSVAEFRASTYLS